MNIIRLSGGAVLFLIGLLSIVAFESIGSLFLFLSQDGAVVAHSMLQLRICLAVLMVVGLVLLFPDRVRQMLATADRFIKQFSVFDFLKVVLITALVVRIIAVLLLDFHLWVDYEEYDNRGFQWARDGSFSIDGEPSAYRPPGWPFLLSRLYLIFGHSPQLGVIANLFFSLAIIVLSFLIVRKIFGLQIARWTAVLLAFFPSQILFVNMLATEPMFTALFLGSIYLFVVSVESKKVRWYIPLIGGLLLGLATLTRALTLVYLIIPVIFWYLRSRSFSGTISLALPALLGFLLIVTPWMYRNQVQLGSFVVSTNSGINLLIGNQPGSGMGWNQPVTDEFDFGDPSREVKIDSIGWSRGTQYIMENPAGFIKRGILKVMFFYAVDMEGVGYELVEAANGNQINRFVFLGFIAETYYILIFLSAIFGVVIWLRNRDNQNRPGGYLFLMTILFWTAVHFVFFADGRFHFPIIPLIAAFAAVNLASSSEKLTQD